MKNYKSLKQSTKKVIAVLISVLMLAGLTACGQDAAAPAGSRTTRDTPLPPGTARCFRIFARYRRTRP